MLENTGGAINNGQSRETGNISRVLMTKKTKTQPTIRNNKNTKIRHEPSYKQLEVKTNRTSFYAEIVANITTRNVKTHNRTTQKTETMINTGHTTGGKLRCSRRVSSS